jgi:hypothetical protein
MLAADKLMTQPLGWCTIHEAAFVSMMRSLRDRQPVLTVIIRF